MHCLNNAPCIQGLDFRVPLLIRIFVRVQGGWVLRTTVYMEYMRIAEIHSTQKSGEMTINRDALYIN